MAFLQYTRYNDELRKQWNVCKFSSSVANKQLCYRHICDPTMGGG